MVETGGTDLSQRHTSRLHITYSLIHLLIGCWCRPAEGNHSLFIIH